MKLVSAALVLATSTLLSLASATEGDWKPCPFSVQPDDVPADARPFECTTQKVPLCYDGICKSDKKIDFFALRRPAMNETTDGIKRAVILIQGGPGESSIGMEIPMFQLQQQLGAVDFYTFDHRGTGRSEYIECEGMRSTSANGFELTLEELAGCLDEINTKYDGQAAGFSVTSAARDVEHLIKTYLSDHHVFLYGYSYGTYLTQRLLQLEIPQVKGYIFDGVDARSNEGDGIETANSHWNKAIHAPSKRLLQYCAADESCPLKLKSVETAYEEVMDMYKRIDAEIDTNECLKKALTIDANGTMLNTTTIRQNLFGMVMTTKTRAEALKNLADLQPCLEPATKKHGGKGLRGSHSEPAGIMPNPLTNTSQVLYSVVVYSERWSQPAPTKAEREKFFLDGPFSSESETLAQLYCVFTGSDEPACTELKDLLPSNATKPFFYKRDEYFTKPLKLPTGTSALVINGGLDFQTPMEFGQLLYKKLADSGDGALMVTFDYGNHCAGEAAAEGEETPCRDSIVAQFVANDGDIDEISLECMETLPPLSFEVSEQTEDDAAAEESK
ncbi:hypothetical protein PINS_up000703 [Pythium insidiosum]|nr:hypothetical protein PINS_up000703 [Pythium insidiosum]